ncbi:MAG: crosslink repair DNA glycosylase YcaQ family protein [Eubacteriales bacterium]
MNITKEQAKKFMMLYHGLLGEYQYTGKSGTLDFINHVTALQYDPIDVCGKSAEIVLHSRVKNFKKSMLFDLLYKDRELIDYFDKCLCIFPQNDFPYLKNRMMYYYKSEISRDKITPICNEIKEIIAKNGAISSKDLDFSEKVDWFWNDTKLSRAALEHLYYYSKLGISHKKGTMKYYDLIENCVKNPSNLQEYQFESDVDRLKWHVYRRIKATGFVWNKVSDAWLNIHGLNAKNRTAVIKELMNEHKIIEIEVIDYKFYIPSTAKDILDMAISDKKHKKRCEFIAPLDSLIWDRKLIKAIFDFDYKWEIYTPKDKRMYGYYTLPIVYGSDFIGRIEAICDRKKSKMVVENIWLEDSVKRTKSLDMEIKKATNQFAKFNECEAYYQ